jgi:hypothetical protein
MRLKSLCSPSSPQFRCTHFVTLRQSTVSTLLNLLPELTKSMCLKLVRLSALVLLRSWDHMSGFIFLHEFEFQKSRAISSAHARAVSYTRTLLCCAVQEEKAHSSEAVTDCAPTCCGNLPAVLAVQGSKALAGS